MIPSMIVFGLLVGYWWKVALVTATLGWPGLLLATGVISIAQIPGAALLAAANAAIGVAVVQAIVFGVRWTKRRAG